MLSFFDMPNALEPEDLTSQRYQQVVAASLVDVYLHTPVSLGPSGDKHPLLVTTSVPTPLRPLAGFLGQKDPPGLRYLNPSIRSVGTLSHHSIFKKKNEKFLLIPYSDSTNQRLGAQLFEGKD